jgi:hypothetical protein
MRKQLLNERTEASMAGRRSAWPLRKPVLRSLFDFASQTASLQQVSLLSVHLSELAVMSSGYFKQFGHFQKNKGGGTGGALIHLLIQSFPFMLRSIYQSL